MSRDATGLPHWLASSGSAMPYQPRACLVRLPIISLVMWCAAALGTAAAQTTSEHGASLLSSPKIVGRRQRRHGRPGGQSAREPGRCLLHLRRRRRDLGRPPASTVSLIAEQPCTGWHRADARRPARTTERHPSRAGRLFRVSCCASRWTARGRRSGGNRLVGRATVTTLADGDAFAYAAIGLSSLGFNDGDDVLCIGGEPLRRLLHRRRVQLLPGRVAAQPSERRARPTSSWATARRRTRV
jgi:hypothetical protein